MYSNGKNQIPVETQVEGNIDKQSVEETFSQILDTIGKDTFNESKLIDKSVLLEIAS